MRILKIASVAAVAMMSVPAVAFADDFEALCTATDKSEPTVASCKCASGKVTGADRSAAIEAMKAMNTAMASGKAEEAAAATQKHGKGIEIVMTAQASCM
jgi:hypothetical protein